MAKRRRYLTLASLLTLTGCPGDDAAGASANGSASGSTTDAATGTDTDDALPTRREVLDSIANLVIFPTHQDFEARAAELSEAGTAMCDALDASSVQAMQAAWRSARAPWRRGSAFEFGPVVEDNIDDAVDFWPVRTDAVDATLAMDVPPTADYVDNLGVASKGLPVIEYLLFDPEGGNAAVLAALQAPDGVGDHRCAFVAALAADVATQSTALRTAWDPAAGNFVAELANAGESSMTFATVQMALDDIVNESIFALQDITDAKLGTPLGSTSGGVAQPEDVESRFSDNSWADIGSDLEGVAAVYLGAPEGFGLTHLVAPEAPDLDQAIRDQIQLCQTSVAGAVDGPPVRTQIVDDPMAVEAIREQVRELRRLFAVDLANLLAVTVTLNDNDGD